MTVYIRTELIEQYGIGHFIRMQSLAMWLCEYGMDCQFYIASEDIQGAFFQDIFTSIRPLADVTYHIVDGSGPDNDLLWLMQVKADDFIVVDSYRLSQDWLDRALGYTKNILLLEDDPASHRAAPTTLDATVGSVRQTRGEAFLGAEYFFASPSLTALHFLKIQELTTSNESAGCISVRHIFIGFGGTDIAQLLPEVIVNLSAWVNANTQLTVAIVPRVKHAENIQMAIAGWPGPVNQVHCYPDVIAALSTADLAIGAAGGNLFERALLGIPSIVVQVADNQSQLFGELQARNLALPLPQNYLRSKDDLLRELENYIGNSTLPLVHRRNGLALSKGLGASWICQWLSRGEYRQVYLQVANPEFKAKLFEWQSLASVRRYARNPQSPTWQEHSVWFDQFLTNPQGILCEIIYQRQSIGMIRLQFHATGSPCYELSIIIDPDFQGRGFAKIAIVRTLQLVPFLTIYAHVKAENVPSKKLFLSCGFVAVSEDWYRYDADQSVTRETQIGKTI